MSVAGATLKVANLKTEQSIQGEEQETRLHATELSLQTQSSHFRRILLNYLKLLENFSI